ncbi:Putative metalloendopeptidase [Komagataella phaffii CBS 7435]|nr:Putative metalloendopeptidase [Komagataella phaffii CBS 7435]SCV11901.1 Putative metalloendopeptidase [Komagataella phaffii CBS 7435]
MKFQAYRSSLCLPSIQLSGSVKTMSKIHFFNLPKEPVHSPVFILHGQVTSTQRNGVLSVVPTNRKVFPVQHFEVNESYFKAILHLEEGENELIIDYNEGKMYGELPSLSGKIYASSTVKLGYEINEEATPIHLCVLVAKDSPLVFDTTAVKLREEGNGLDLAIQKLRMGGRLMQAFTQEAMMRNGFGPRCFRFVEEETTSTISRIEQQYGVRRKDIKVHVLRSEKSLRELRDPNLAQQNKDASDAGGLFGIAISELCRHGINKGQAAVMFLDTHYDRDRDLILTHAALGGGNNDIKLAIFGSHGLYSWPTCFETVVPSFQDTRRPAHREVANDCGQCSSYWECLTVTLGAFMHEIGHLLGCPHQENGVMLRDYITMNRSFITRETACIRTHQTHDRIVLARDEPSWHRLDILRFLYHRSFSVKTDDYYNMTASDSNTDITGVGEDKLLIANTSGVYLIEFHVGEWSKLHYENLPKKYGGTGALQKLVLEGNQIRKQLSLSRGHPKITVRILSVNRKERSLDDFERSLKELNSTTKVNNITVHRSAKLGSNRSNTPEQSIAQSVITSIRIYHGAALDGLEVNGGKALLGRKTASYSDFVIAAGDSICQVNVRNGVWIDSIQFITKNGQQSPIYGNATGGSLNQISIVAPYNLKGFFGNCSNWMDSLGVLYG